MFTIAIVSVVLTAAALMILSPVRNALTTITWGSGGVLGGTMASVIVDSIRFKPKNFAAEIEDNNGFTAATVDLFDGFDATAECIYDTAINWPAQGTNVTLTYNTINYTVTITSVEDEKARKKESHRTIELRYRPGIHSPGSVI